jgi:RNA-directed DNA polymerase
MVTALEHGVKGDKWFSLMDKVFSPANLAAAWQKVQANAGAAGADHQTIEMFATCAAANLEHLHTQLRAGTYRPAVIKRVWIPKPGSREQRPLGIPTVRDRVVQTAVRQVIEPIFEREFCTHSYGFRPGRGCQQALSRVSELLAGGYGWVIDADVRQYFDSIPHERLLDLVRERIADGKVLQLIADFLQQGVLDGLTEWTPEQGTPQGAVISPLLANLYLHPLDKLAQTRGWEMVRYADDFVVLCRSQAEAHATLQEIAEWMSAAGLRLHEEKTRIVEMGQRGGFDFLGYHFEAGYKWPRRKSEQQIKEKLRPQTRRHDGRSLRAISAGLSRTLRGWYEYYKHSNGNIFRRLDQWLRGRLRSILRRREKRKGRARGSDHQKWPNAYFAEQGLYSLATAHAMYRHSQKG